MQKVVNNQSYSKLAINFADFMNQIVQDIITDKAPLDFKLDFIDHSLKTGSQNPFRLKNKSNQQRYFSKDGLSKPVARILLNNLDLDRLSSYINSLLDDDEDGVSASDLCESFFSDNEEIDLSNIAYSLAIVYRNILKERIAQKDERPGARKEIKEVFMQQAEIELQPSVEKRLKDVLDIIFSKNPKNDLADFRMVPACIKEKIADNPPFKEKVDRMILPYYRYIEELLKAKCEENSVNFEHIASYIQNLYDDYKVTYSDQEDIFNAITEYFVTITHHKAKKSTCEILTSFFIQNCEVFDVIA